MQRSAANRAFDHYLRTGRRLPSFSGRERERELGLKSNPYHDPRNGRFTIGTGTPDGSWAGGGYTGGGGGDFSGGGTTGGWSDDHAPIRKSPQRPAAGTEIRSIAQKPPTSSPVRGGQSGDRTIVRNGYTYRIDSADRTTSVTGTLTLSPAARSRRAQRLRVAVTGFEPMMAGIISPLASMGRLIGSTISRRTRISTAAAIEFWRMDGRKTLRRASKSMLQLNRNMMGLPNGLPASISFLLSTVSAAHVSSPTSREAMNMASETGPLLSRIGDLLSDDPLYPDFDTFLYVEADDGWVDISIFKDIGDQILWRDGPRALTEALFELWYAEPSEKRWTTMQYRLEGGQFEASFTYEPTDPEVSTMDRRQHILDQRYGNKKIVYPPLEGNEP